MLAGSRFGVGRILSLANLVLHPQATIHVMGKGRRERILPLWKETATVLRDWLKVRGEPKTTALFPNARGDSMTRCGVRIHYRETRSNCQRKTTRSGQETGLTAQA